MRLTMDIYSRRTAQRTIHFPQSTIRKHNSSFPNNEYNAIKFDDDFHNVSRPSHTSTRHVANTDRQSKR